jgi:hypothetical protein
MLARWLGRYALALVAAFAVGGLAAWQLFHQPIIGIADNRDFQRVMAQVGLRYRESLETTVFKWIQLRFDVGAPRPVGYLTSEVLLARLALPVSRALFGRGAFDLRALGAVQLALYVPAVALFVAVHRQRRRLAQLLVAALALLLLADVKLVAYFNSFYSESASLIFGLWAMGLALILCGLRRGAGAWVAYAAFVAATVLFALAKSQNLAFVPAPALLAALLFPELPARPSGLAARARWLALLPALALLALPAWTLGSGAYGSSTRENVRVQLDEEIFPHSPTPNLDRWELDVHGRDYSRVTFATLARFHLRHPGRWWAMAERAAGDAFYCIPYGNFERSTGRPPFAVDDRIAIWGELQRRYAPRWLPLLIALTLALAALWGWQARTAADAVRRRRALVALAWLAGCVAEFIVTITFEANGNAKHLFIFDVIIYLLVILAVADLAELAQAARKPPSTAMGAPVT